MTHYLTKILKSADRFAGLDPRHADPITRLRARLLILFAPPAGVLGLILSINYGLSASANPVGSGFEPLIVFCIINPFISTFLLALTPWVLNATRSIPIAGTHYVCAIALGALPLPLIKFGSFSPNTIIIVIIPIIAGLVISQRALTVTTIFAVLYLLALPIVAAQGLIGVSSGMSQLDQWHQTLTLIVCCLSLYVAASGFLGLYNDALRRAQASSRMAKQASEAKSNFLATMSHELRTPLNGILGFARLLEDEAQTANARLYAEKINHSGQTLLALLNDVLDISKIEAGAMDLEQAPLSLRDIIHDVADLYRPLATEKGLSLKVDIASTVPDQLIGDAVRLRQILMNLTSNALKFTRTGGVTLRIRQTDTCTPDRSVTLQFDIVDTGIGIPDHVIPRLFKRFRQADMSTTREFGGTGLGLSICRSLAHLMGGDIAVQSIHGAGSTFTFTARFALSDNTQTATLSSHEAQYDQPPKKVSPVQILVAEDNPTNQLLIQALLERAGYGVQIVENGQHVLDALERGRFDIILMDGHMPRMNGIEATQRIRSTDGPHTDIPIIALTADTMSGDQQLYLDAGMDDYLSKPVDFGTLFAKIEHWSVQKRCAHPVEETAQAVAGDAGLSR